MLNKLKSDAGFLGHTHALSAVAVWLLLIAFFPNFAFNTILGTKDLSVLLISIIVVTGFSLFPDFDNVKSTAISTLGVIGVAISKFMRSTSVAVYMASRTRRDAPTADPHRGFWHTLASAFLMGFIVFITTSINIPIPIMGTNVSLSFLIATLWIYVCLKVGISGLFAKFTRKMKKEMFHIKLGIDIASIAIIVLLLLIAPKNISYSWMAYSAILGYSIHILGDTMTVAGTPLLWPYVNKGKRWWTYRFFKIKAGGTTENLIFLPLFAVIIVLSLLKIIIKM